MNNLTSGINISTAARESNNCEKEILKSLNDQRELGLFTDITVTGGSARFPYAFGAHKNILAAQSPLLADLMENEEQIEISDMSAEAVEAFLDYLYVQKQPDAQNVMEMFKLAAKYEVAKLKTICEKIIQENLDESNAFEIFKLACGPHKSEKLKVVAFAKLQEKFRGELHHELLNDPEKLQKIIDGKKVMDELMK